MAANKQESGERYNPITGIGIPATPARINSSAIFGGSPSSIEYMFIPPSATTRSTKPPSSSEKRRSLSRESLRRSFPPVSEGQPDSDECSSVSDVSECGNEAEQRDRSRSNLNALPRTGKPLSRSTSSRLPVSVARPRVMKRAHSFTRETNRSPRGTTNEPQVTHSAADLTNQLKKPNASATSKIPRKPTTSARTVGPQSSHLPVKRADVNSNTAENGARKSGNQSPVVKRTEPQVSGIPVKTSTLQKRTTYNTKETTETEATLKKTTATGSGIPVKGSGTKPQQHSGSSRIPQLKPDGPQVGTSIESEQPKENFDRVNDDIKIAMQAGKQLLQREGTGDELRVAKADAAKSKLPRRSSIPRSSTSKVVQKTKNGEKTGKESTNVKSQQTVKSSESGLPGSKVRTTGVSKIPVNKRVEHKPANRSPASPSSMSQGSDTDSVSGKEDAAEETGNEFCLSRENSKSKIPIMSWKSRTAAKTSEADPNENEVNKSVGVGKEKTEKPKQESWPSDDSVSKESEITEKRSVSGSMLGLKQELTGKTSISRDSHPVAMQQPKLREPDVVLVTGNNADERLESGLGPSKDDVIEPDSLPSRPPNKELVTVTTKPQRVQRESDVLHECEGLVTRKDNNQVGNVLVPRTHVDVQDTSSCDQTDVLSNNGYCYTAEDVQEMASVGRHPASLPVGNQDHDVVSTKKKTWAETRSNLEEPVAETRSNLKKPGTETRSNLKKPGAETRSNLKEPGQDASDVNTNSNENLKIETRGRTYNRTAGATLEGKTRQLIHSEKCLGDAGMENKNTAESKMKRIVNEKHDASSDLEKETERYMDVQTRQLSELDKCLEEPGADTEKPGVDTQEPGTETEEPAKRSDTCFECRMEKSETEDEVGEMDDIRRYPTFISPRKSLVLCKHHEKLKNETSQSADDPDNHLVPMTSLPVVKNGHVSDLSLKASPEILPKNSTNRGQDVSAQDIEKTTAKNTVEDKLANHVSKRGFGGPVVDKFRETPKLKNAAPIRDANPVSKNEPAIRNIDQRKTAQNNAREKDAKNVGGPKGSHSPLLALSRDKKFVSGENLAAAKNTENIKSALSLEWDDIGTELDPPNFSEDDDDEEDILEPGINKLGQDKGDSRGPGVKLMNTNEALDKLKVIQSLIMKEAENRSRKKSEESAGKYAVGMKGPGDEQQNLQKNIGMSMTPPLEKQRSDGYQIRREEVSLSNQVSPTSGVPRREVSSPTIWDKISDNTISQDQTTELLNETLAKLKASPQLSSNAFARRTISSRSLPGSRQTSKEQLLSDTERPVYVYTSSWMNRSGKNSRGSSLSLCSANRSLPSSRQNLAKDPFNALKRSESASGRIMEKENGKRIEGKEKKEFRLSDFDEINLSDDGIQEMKNQKSNKPSISPVVEKPRNHDVQNIKPSLKMSKRRKKSKNTAASMNNAPLYGASMEELADGKATCQCGGKKCVIS